MRGVLLVALSVLSSVAFGQSKVEPTTKSMLRFEDFRVPTPLAGRKDNAVVDRPNFPIETGVQFGQRLAKEARKGPNFAGHYTIVIWSCGSPCSNVAILDAETGERYDIPFVGELGWGSCEGGPDADGELLSYRIDSSLLIVTGRLEIPDPQSHMLSKGPCRRHYYQWDGHRLSLIRAVIPIQGALSK
jgi:hypothetical protein